MPVSVTPGGVIRNYRRNCQIREVLPKAAAEKCVPKVLLRIY